VKTIAAIIVVALAVVSLLVLFAGRSEAVETILCAPFDQDSTLFAVGAMTTTISFHDGGRGHAITVAGTAG
jgi:hypothetical protein